MKLRALIAAAALFLPGALPAQSRVTVPVQDPVYRDLDRLIALRLVEIALQGQRPYSRREIARIVREARNAVEARPASGATRRAVERLATRFAADISELEGVRTAAPLRLGGQVDFLGVSSPFRDIPRDSVGSVAARVNPLLDERSGRRWVPGANVAIEGLMERRVGITTLALRPRVTAGGQGGEFSAAGSLQAGELTIPVRNVTVGIGRQQLVWGQGMSGGLLFSASGRPLDALRISTDLPFMGWLIRGGTPMRGSVVVADLGSRQAFPHSILVAYKLSGHPFSIERFELAASVQAIQGGEGAPRASLRDHVMDLIPALKYLLPDNDAQFSNKLAGWEYRLRLPELHGLQLYAEHAFDDMDPRRWKSTFWEDAGHILGASLTDLGPDGRVSGALEFHHTGLRFYQHTVFSSGVAFNGTLMGDPLGKQGNGIALRLQLDDRDDRTFLLDAAVEQRDSDVITTAFDNAELDNFRFVRLERRPAEWRSRVIGSWQAGDHRRRARLQAGYERVLNYGSAAGTNRHNWLIGVSLSTESDQRP